MKKFLLTAVVLITASPVMATTIDFTTSAPNNNAFGNFIEITVDGVTARLSGFSGTSLSSSFTTSQVHQWSTGVGSCNQGEGSNCGSGPHTVDNDGYGDLLLITFSESVLVTNALIAAWARDFDAMYWGGTGAFTATNFNALGSGFLDSFLPNNANTNGTTTRNVPLTGLANPIDWLVFAPPPFSLNPDGNTDKGKKDMFKFRSVSFTVPEEDTPEPGTLLLLAIGTAFVAARSRKQS